MVTVIKQSAEKITNVKSEKYGINLNVIEEKYLSSQRFRILFIFKKIERSKNFSDRLDKHDRKTFAAKKIILCNSIEMGEKVLVLVKRIKKSAPGKFCKQTVQNIPYFNKKQCLK